MKNSVNIIEEITISLPLSSLAEIEQISLFAVYNREREKQTAILPTAISTDEEKINFTYSVVD